MPNIRRPQRPMSPGASPKTLTHGRQPPQTTAPGPDTSALAFPQAEVLLPEGAEASRFVLASRPLVDVTSLTAGHAKHVNVLAEPDNARSALSSTPSPTKTNMFFAAGLPKHSTTTHLSMVSDLAVYYINPSAFITPHDHESSFANTFAQADYWRDNLFDLHATAPQTGPNLFSNNAFSHEASEPWPTHIEHRSLTATQHGQSIQITWTKPWVLPATWKSVAYEKPPHFEAPRKKSANLAVSLRVPQDLVKYSHMKPVDPITGEYVAFGTPNAITLNAFYKRKLVHADTGVPVSPGTPGAISYAAFKMRQLVDPQTGQRVAAGTHGAIATSVFQDRKRQRLKKGSRKR